MQKLRTIVTFLCFLLPIALQAQETVPPTEPDDGMNIFLLVIGTVFLGVMLGGAIIGAFMAAVVVLLFLGFVALGIVSTSVVVGLATRSLPAGIRTMLLLVFGPAGSLFGLICLHIFNRFFPLPLSSSTLTFTGLAAGFCGGMLLALFIFRVLRQITVFVASKAGHQQERKEH